MTSILYSSSCIMFTIVSALVFSALLYFSGYNHSVEGVSLSSGWWIEDYLSVSLNCLTVFVVICSLISSDSDFIIDENWVNFAVCVVIVGVSCILFFSCAGFFLFFFFFESSLIPTFVLVLGWGYQPERLQAGLQIVVYTVCGSLPLLVLLCSVWVWGGSDNIVVLSYSSVGLISDLFVVWFLLILGMMVKVPVFLVHGWLPKAHVEAPLSGSILLAGVLLKLGIYGICRVVWCLGTPPLSLVFGVVVVSLWGGVVCSFLCLCFHDVKSVIAYSSIAHMSLSLSGVVGLSNLGWMSGICMVIAHGICSPCLFALANYTYFVTGSRSLLLCKGVLKSIPVLSSMWFIFCAINIGCPPSANFFSECILFCSIIGFSFGMIVPLFLLCFLAAGYSLFLYSTVNHGYQTLVVRSFGGFNLRFLVCIVLSFIILFGVFIGLDSVFL